MPIWSAEIRELERLLESLKDHLPTLEKELTQLIRTEDPNVLLLYSRRCLEVIITDLCECELKRDRGTEPLKGIIDKLNKEKKVPSHIITSMHGLNDLSTYGTHPKDFDPKQVKPVLINLDIITRWYLIYKGLGEEIPVQVAEETLQEIKTLTKEGKRPLVQKNKKSLMRSGIILAVLIVMAVLYFTHTIGGGNLTKGLEKSIAVLPFRNDSPSDSNQYFIDGFMVNVLSHLQTIKDLIPISRTSVERYRKTTKSIPEIANELGVNYIVEGDMQRYGNRISLSVNLFRALKKELRLWGKTYEQKINDATDILSLQSQIAQSIAGELEAVITPKEKQLIEGIPTKNLDAYEAWMKGNFYSGKLTQKDLETGLKYYEFAKELDPKYAPAYEGISAVWLARQIMGYASPEEALPIQKEAIMKAIALDSTINLSGYYTWGLFDWEKGEKEFKKAIKLNPNDAVTRGGYSALLIILGRNEEALKQINVALNLDPLNVWIKAIYGNVLISAHRYPEAIKAYQSALKIDPNYPLAQGNLVGALFFSGKYKEAVEQNKLSCGNDTELVNALEKGYKQGGFKGAQLSYAKVVESRYKKSFWPPCDIAGTYAGIGEKEKALYWLEQAYKLHDPNLPWLLNPVYDNLRDDPRFQDLCKRMNLPYK